jgi:hypothetical protein
MSIEIHQPEIEALIQQRMASGAFQDVEEVLIHALKSAPVPDVPSAKPFGRKLVDAFAEAREILGGVELDFTRDPSPGRPVDLS